MKFGIHPIVNDRIDAAVTDNVVASDRGDIENVVACGPIDRGIRIPLIAEVIYREAAGSAANFRTQLDARNVFVARKIRPRQEFSKYRRS